MDNYQSFNNQPAAGTTPQLYAGPQPYAPQQQYSAPQQGGTQPQPYSMQQTVQTPVQVKQPTEPVKKDNSSLIKTIIIVALSVLLATFIGLFIWMLFNYTEAKNNLDSKINIAVAEAKEAQAEELEAEFAEREKNPYETFAGPADYGELSFEYPKTWSVYIESDASKGGDFKAYLNPGGVNTVSEKTLNALRVSILDKSFETVTADYKKQMDKKDSNLKVQATTVNGVSANRYSGTIPGTEFNGYIVIFKIRDKTAVFRTDSVLFANDFDTLLKTINFNA